MIFEESYMKSSLKWDIEMDIFLLSLEAVAWGRGMGSFPVFRYRGMPLLVKPYAAAAYGCLLVCCLKSCAQEYSLTRDTYTQGVPRAHK